MYKHTHEHVHAHNFLAKAMEFVCVDQLLLGMESALEYGLYIQGHSIEENCFQFPSRYQLQIAFD